jgi:hypothetical protein
MAMYQVGGIVDASPYAEPEDNLSFLSWVKLDGNLNCGAGIEGGPKLARESFARQGRWVL